MNELELKRMNRLEQELRSRIQAAQLRGDRREVERLQRKFRESGLPIIRYTSAAPVL